MTLTTVFGLFPMLLGVIVAQPGAMPQGVTRLVAQNGIIWRVPVQPRPQLRRIEWVEHKGPRCIPAAAIRRALLFSPEQVDFVLADRSRIRAKFNGHCAALDFYGGFYLQPDDDRLCARRDAIHSRMGGSCTIGRFRHLEPRLKR
ncbi:MAG: hypothetical protein ACREBK_02750 [Sphingomicrobium sp.]